MNTCARVRVDGYIDPNYGIKVFGTKPHRFLSFMLFFKSFTGKFWCRTEVRVISPWKIDHYIGFLKGGNWIKLDGYFEIYRDKPYFREEEISVSVLRGMQPPKKQPEVINHTVVDPNQVDYEIEQEEEF